MLRNLQDQMANPFTFTSRLMIYMLRLGNMEMSKQISAKLMAFITENETFVNLSQLAQYNGMTVKATEAIYRTANKESLAQILAIISVEKNGKVNPSLKNATVQNT